jgi:type II secretory pathway pseudopilin PulG
MPAWILRLTPWELAGVVAYTQMFALLESLIVLCILLILAFLLPTWLYARKFVAVSAALVLLNSAWFAAAQYNYDSVRLWGVRQSLPWLLLFLITNAAVYLLVNRSSGFEKIVQSITQRVAVLSVVYLAFSVISIFIVVIRNL